ncbi:hydroxymethylbilane synthase [Agrococcus sp. ARC_14]|uniref:hydroxymethylbilane synthase n=1 Tax=Agrococcus sp. ARC_14 TaxID=2919927 RepID=UPI001F060B0B|nr:hydroxymethylbilane synthase [Agrococcus sp. ARC_14]MCH1881680.1 hydroxymethylbilane synthase [Agrococcus sp. ARC_14]
MSALKVGTRGSALALAQTKALAARFAGEVEIVEITTKGDTDRSSLSQLGGTGVFVSALRDALLDGTVDVAVHSMKDLPTAAAPGIELAAVAKREDSRDALCARDGLRFADLPEGAKVGTGSPRRAAQLRVARPDLEIVDIRGNVPTRLARAQGDSETGEGADLDAVVLALAGLKRLGLEAAATDILELIDFPTAPGQGALAVEVRADDAPARKAVAKTDHAPSRFAADAERRVLAGLEAGCAAPLAAHAEVADGMLFLTAVAYATDGSKKLTASHAYTLDSTSVAELAAAAADVAERAVGELMDAGAAALIA